MKTLLKKAIDTIKADYADIRFEEQDTTVIAYAGKELEAVSETYNSGGIVRTLVNGGWGSASFNKVDKLSEYCELAGKGAKLTGKEKSYFAKAPKVDTVVQASFGKDPRKISLEEKHNLAKKYNDIILGVAGIASTSVRYADKLIHKYFVNSDGSAIEQSLCMVELVFAAIAKDGTNVQNYHRSFGTANEGFAIAENREHHAEEVAKSAVDMLKGEKVTPGTYTVIADPDLIGVFAHEAFGHLSESDAIYENEQFKQIMKLGRTMGVTELSIVDDGTIPGLRGSFEYDEDGVKSEKTYLIKDGILVGRLHSRETAARMNEKPTGSSRALSYAFRPIVRMRNTFIEPQNYKFEKMLSEVKNGIYAKGTYGGNTNLEQFSFIAKEAFEIKDGKLGKRLRGVTLSGNVFDTLKNIDAIGDDLEILNSGGCGKGGQMPLPVSTGGPHVRIKNVLIG